MFSLSIANYLEMNPTVQINWDRTSQLYGAGARSRQAQVAKRFAPIFRTDLTIQRMFRPLNRVFRRIAGRDIDLFAMILRMQADLQQNDTSSGKPEVKVLLRVDDFPRHDLSLLDFQTFWRVLDNYDIRIVLGVTPLIASNPDRPTPHVNRKLTTPEIDFLYHIVEGGHEIAMHGLTHSVRKDVKAEYVGVSPQEVEENILTGMEVFKDLGIEVKAIIPPYNGFDAQAFAVFAKYFDVVHGGPETIDFFGGYFSPVFLGETLFVASYPGLYGTAQNIHDRLLTYRLARWSRIYYLPITVHWAWELKDNFAGLNQLLSHLTTYSQW